MMKIAAVPLVLCLLFSACTPPAGNGSPSGENRVPFDPDLYSWKTASWTPFTVADTISGFAYGTPEGNDRYVAVARTGVIGWSSNGDVWHRAVKLIPVTDPPADPALVPDPFNASFNAAAWGGGIFAAVGNGGKIAWSQDGISWTSEGYSGGITGFGTENIMGIAWGQGVFVAVGGNANIAYSSDGRNWTGCRDSAFGTSQLNDIAFDSSGGRFYIVGNDGKRGWSDDPASGNWHLLELPGMDTPPFGKNHIRKVTVGRYGEGIGIGVVFNEWGGKRTVIATNNAFGNFDADLHTDLFGDNNINGIAWGGGCFVAAGTAAMIGWWPSAEPSNNSQRHWRALSFTEFHWWEISALAALKDRFFAGGVGGKIGYSK
jgi:hypothetical protein